MIDLAHQSFVGAINTILPSQNDFSILYAWLLASLWHDTGRLLGQLGKIEARVLCYEEDEDQLVSEEASRKEKVARTVTYQNFVGLLSDFLEYLVDGDFKSGYTPNMMVPIEEAKYYTVINSAFFEPGSHGVGSAYFMWSSCRNEILKIKDRNAQIFMMHHLLVAALSAALHDRELRSKLREAGITKIITSHFPLASLLMVIDSLQEDGRWIDRATGSHAVYNFLEGFELDEKTIKPIINLPDHHPFLDKITEECLEIQEFLEPDGMEIYYPEELIKVG